MQVETMGNSNDPSSIRNDYVQLTRTFKRVALKTKNNQSIVETTNKFEDSNIRLFMVCDFKKWEAKATERDHCKELFC